MKRRGRRGRSDREDRCENMKNHHHSGRFTEVACKETIKRNGTPLGQSAYREVLPGVVRRQGTLWVQSSFERKKESYKKKILHVGINRCEQIQKYQRAEKLSLSVA